MKTIRSDIANVDEQISDLVRHNKKITDRLNYEDKLAMKLDRVKIAKEKYIVKL